MGEVKSYMVSFDIECSEKEKLDLEHIDGNLYKLKMAPLFSEEAGFGDIVKVQEVEDNVLFIERVVKKSEFKRFDWVLPKNIVESKEFENLKKDIENECGDWEIAFGGVFIVHLPKESSYDVHRQLQKVFDTVLEK